MFLSEFFFVGFAGACCRCRYLTTPGQGDPSARLYDKLLLSFNPLVTVVPEWTDSDCSSASNALERVFAVKSDICTSIF